jgi:hypothetical protein
MSSEEGNSGRAGLAGTALRRAPGPLGSGGLPDARLAHRSRRRRPRGLAAAQPCRPRRRAQSRRMAHHRRRPGVPGHAPLARRAPRRTTRRTAAGAGSEPRRGGRSRAGSPDGRVGRSSAARGARYARSGRAARVRAARHVRRPLRRDRSVLGRSPNATKQLASRARQRVQAAEATPDNDVARQTHLVKAFLSASRSGDFAALLAVLDPDVVLHPDATAIRSGALAGIRGAAAVATQFAGRAQGAQPALVNGLPGAVWTTTHGTPRGAFRFTITHGKIVRIDIVMDTQQLRQSISSSSTAESLPRPPNPVMSGREREC